MTCIRTKLFTQKAHRRVLSAQLRHTQQGWPSQMLHSSHTAPLHPRCSVLSWQLWCILFYSVYTLESWHWLLKWALFHKLKWKKGVLIFFLLQVMMMVLPLLIFVLLPKVVNTSDPDMRRVSWLPSYRLLSHVVSFKMAFQAGVYVHVCMVCVLYVLTDTGE